MNKTNLWVAFCQGIFIVLAGIAILMAGLSISYSFYEKVDKTLFERRLEALKFDHNKELTALKLEYNEVRDKLSVEELKGRYGDMIIRTYEDAGCNIHFVDGKAVVVCKLDKAK